MGARGPKPKPDSRRSRAGTNTIGLGGRKPAKPVPVVPPAGLVSDPVASAFWKRLAPGLVKSGRLTPDRAEAFANLCRIKSDCDALTIELREGGWISLSERGPVPNPVQRMLRDSRRDFLAHAREFGLTFAAASRLPGENEDGEVDAEQAAKLARFFGPRSA